MKLRIRLYVSVIFFLFLAATVACAGDSAPTAERASGGKRLIEFGWDEPSTVYVKDHIREMEALPFDGLVMSVRYLSASGTSEIFAQRAFGSERIEWDAVADGVQALKETDFKRFTETFLRFNLTPGDVDWFDDFSTPLHNTALVGRMVREGGVKGIFFDVEPYEFKLFSYTHRPGHNLRSFTEYKAQVYKRGAEVMKALQSEAPDLTVFLSISYDQAKPPARDDKYGLLPAFLDGMLSAAEGGTQFLDGFEAGYGFMQEREFEEGYQTIHTTNKTISSNPIAYAARFSAAFGLWMDLESPTSGWNVDDTERNRFSPSRFSSALTHALKRSDGYAWIYTQEPKWWSNEKLPPAYIQAVKDARRNAGMNVW